jgi:hypothetical protein
VFSWHVPSSAACRPASCQGGFFLFADRNCVWIDNLPFVTAVSLSAICGAQWYLAKNANCFFFFFFQSLAYVVDPSISLSTPSHCSSIKKWVSEWVRERERVRFTRALNTRSKCNFVSLRFLDTPYDKKLWTYDNKTPFIRRTQTFFPPFSLFKHS